MTDAEYTRKVLDLLLARHEIQTKTKRDALRIAPWVVLALTLLSLVLITRA